MHRSAFLTLTLSLLPACTIIQVSGADPSTSLHFGVLKLEPAPGARSLSYRIQGFGLVPGHNGATLGFAREDVVLVFDPNDCRTIIFDAPDNDLVDAALAAGAACQPGGGEQ